MVVTMSLLSKFVVRCLICCISCSFRLTRFLLCRDTCGPLCGAGDILPDPDKLVNGQSCSDWDYASRYLPSSYPLYQDGNNGKIRTCSDYFDRIAYGCGCQSSIQLDGGCGPLCKDGAAVPEPVSILFVFVYC